MKNLSKTKSGIELYNNEEIFLFSPDRFSENKLKKYISEKRNHCIDCDISEEESCKCNKLLPFATDALYIKIIEGYYPELYLIEFKNFDIYNNDITSGGSLNDYDLFKDDVDSFVKDIYDDNFKNKLKEILKKGKKANKKKFRLEFSLKASETILSLLPHLYLYYANKNGFNENEVDVKGFSSFLANCKKEYIIGYNNINDNLSQYESIIRQEIQCTENAYYLQKLRRHPFENIHFFPLEEEFVNYINNL